MNTYETLLVTSPDLTEADEASLVSGFVGVVDEGGGSLVVRERLGRRRLAYPIKKFDDGVYTLFLYDAEPAVAHEIERRVRLSDKVLRWLTIHIERRRAETAKQNAVRDAEARVQAEAARAAAAEKARAEVAARAQLEAEAAEKRALEAAAAADAAPADAAPADAAPADAAAGETEAAAEGAAAPPPTDTPEKPKPSEGGATDG